jgi:hypothetical protein
VNRQAFAMALGLAIVAAHIAITFFFLLVFDAPDAVAIEEISLPITVAYTSAIVMWFFANNGLITSDERIGLPLVAVVVMIVAAMIGGLFYVPWSFMQDETMTVSTVNRVYLGLESAFGGVFGIIMTELFGYRRSAGRTET